MPDAIDIATSTAAAITKAPGPRLRGKAPAAPASKTLRQIRKAAQFNIIYHGAREAHLDAVHRWFMFGVIALGAGGVLTMMSPIFGAVCAAFSAVIGALDLTFDLSNRARAHALMRRRYSALAAEAEANPDDLARIDAQLIALQSDEEPGYIALLALCHNRAESQIYGDDDEHLSVPWIHRIFANLIRFDGHEYPLKSAKAA